MIGEARSFGFGLRAVRGSRSVLSFGALRAGARLFHVLAYAAQLILANGQFETQASEFTLHLLVAMFRSEDRTFNFTLLQVDVFQSLLRELQIGV